MKLSSPYLYIDDSKSSNDFCSGIGVTELVSIFSGKGVIRGSDINSSILGIVVTFPVNFSLFFNTYSTVSNLAIKYTEKRVVSIPIPAPSMFISIDGKADKLVGVHGLTKTAMKGKFLGKLFPEVLSLPSDFVGKGFNFMPNVERVLELEPDLVFQWGNYGIEIFDPAGPLVLVKLK